MIGNALPFTDPTLAPLLLDNMNYQINAMNNFVDGIPLLTYVEGVAKDIPMTNKIIPPSPLAQQMQTTLVHY